MLIFSLKLSTIAIAILAVSALATLLGCLGEANWFLDLFTHFRLVYLKLQLLALVLFGIGWFRFKRDDGRKDSRWLLGMLVSLLFVFGNMKETASYLFPSLPKQVPHSRLDISRKRLKLLHANVYIRNHDATALARLIHDEQPDVIDLVEYSNEWEERLEKTGILKTYLYRTHNKLFQDSELQVYSRYPLLSWQMYRSANHPNAFNNENLLVKLLVGNQPVELLVVHPPLPVTSKYANLQAEAMRTWARLAQHSPRPFLIAGDFNTTPWTGRFRKLLKQSSLRTSTKHHAITGSTWPVYPPFIPALRPLPTLGLLGIPIDHVLYSKEFWLGTHKVGPSIGSDHLPVIDEFWLNL